MTERKLTAKQEAFVAAYLTNGRKAAEAYRTAYDSNASPQRCAEDACRLLKHPKIAPRVAKVVEKAAELSGITVGRVLAELERMAFYDPADIAGVKVTEPKDIAALPDAVRRAIVGWGWDRAGNFTLKLADKRGSLELIGRHLAMFVERKEITGKDGGAVEIDATVRAAEVHREVMALLGTLPSPSEDKT